MKSGMETENIQFLIHVVVVAAVGALILGLIILVICFK